MLEEHSANEAAENEDNSRLVNRRRFVKSLGVAGGAAALGTLGSVRTSAKNNNVEKNASNIDIHEVQSHGRTETVNTALNDDRSEVVYDALVDSGSLDPQPDQSQVYRTTTSSDSWLTVVVPFVPAPGNEQINLFWTTNKNLTTQVSMSHLYPPSSASEPWNVREAYFAHGSVTVREGTEPVPHPKTDGPSPQFLGCHSPNWGCILSTAGAYAGTIGACGSCAVSEGLLIPACASCIGTILGSAGLTITCDYCG